MKELYIGKVFHIQQVVEDHSESKSAQKTKVEIEQDEWFYGVIPNAVVDPGTVVVHFVHASVAAGAMVRVLVLFNFAKAAVPYLLTVRVFLHNVLLLFGLSLFFLVYDLVLQFHESWVCLHAHNMAPHHHHIQH